MISLRYPVPFSAGFTLENFAASGMFKRCISIRFFRFEKKNLLKHDPHGWGCEFIARHHSALLFCRALMRDAEVIPGAGPGAGQKQGPFLNPGSCESAKMKKSRLLASPCSA